MSSFTKAEKKQLRRLAGIAYERELERELSSLLGQFQNWRNGEIDPFELSDHIHEFHEGPNRGLYNFYNRADPHMAVARALVEELLSESEVPDDSRLKLVSAVDFYRAERERNNSNDDLEES
jgi:hypothetical protein